MTHISNRAPSPSSLVIFSIDQRRYAIPLQVVQRILTATHVRPLRGASRKVVGMVRLPGHASPPDPPRGGLTVPVLSLRRHLGLGERKVEPTDRLLVIRCRNRLIALVAEEIEDDLKLTRGAEPAPIAEMQAKGLVSLDGLCLIADVDRLMTHQDECQLDKALSKHRRRVDARSRTRLSRPGASTAESGVHLAFG